MLLIMTRKEQEVADDILRSLGRGVTMLNAAGAYTGEPRRVLLCAVRRRRSTRAHSGMGPRPRRVSGDRLHRRRTGRGFPPPGKKRRRPISPAPASFGVCLWEAGSLRSGIRRNPLYEKIAGFRPAVLAFFAGSRIIGSILISILRNTPRAAEERQTIMLKYRKLKTPLHRLRKPRRWRKRTAVPAVLPCGRL